MRSPNLQTLYVCCQLFYPECISTGQKVTELCEALHGHEIPIHVLCGQPTILSSTKVDTHMTYQGITIERLFSTSLPKVSLIYKAINHITFYFSLFFRMIKLKKNSKLLLFTEPPFLPWLMILLYPIKRFEYSIVVFDVYPETLVAESFLKPTHILVRLWRLLNRIAYNHAAHIISIGRCMSEVLTTNNHVQTGRLSYIPMWANSATLQKNTQSPYKKKWKLDHHFIVGYAGNLARFHPIETIMHAALALKDTVDIAFVFVGNGAKKQWAQHFATTHHLSNCHFYSYVEKEAVADVLSSFDCGILGLNAQNTGLSVPSKTFGLLCTGTPIIACCTPHSEIASILSDHHCGSVIDPSDSNALAKEIVLLKSNTDLQQQYSTNGKQASQKMFSVQTVALNYFNLLYNS